MWDLAGAGLSALSSLAGGFISDASNRKLAQQQYQYQKEFAQNSIQWKVADAQKAGIHPLYALGNNATTYTPSSYNSSIGAGVADAGNALGAGLSKALNKDAKENSHLQNELLRTQIETQRLTNNRISQELAQNSNQMNSIAQGIQANNATKSLQNIASQSTKSLSTAQDELSFYQGSDIKQVKDEIATESLVRSFVDNYLNVPPHQKEAKKVDVLKSLGGELHMVNKKNATTTDYYLYNLREKFLNWFSNREGSRATPIYNRKDKLINVRRLP